MHFKGSGLSIKKDQHQNVICKHCCEHAKFDSLKTNKKQPDTLTRGTLKPSDYKKNFQKEKIEILVKNLQDFLLETNPLNH